MFLAIRREGQTVSRMQEVAGQQEERVLAVDEFGNESWVPPDRLTGNGEAQQPHRRQGALVEERARPRTAPEDTTTANDNSEAAVDEEAVVILPQEPTSFWSTFGGCSVFFCGSFLFVSWFVVGPSVMLGLMFGAPNFAPVVSILGALAWMISYPIYIHRVYYPGRPWMPVLDGEGQAQVREVNGQPWVYAQKECGLPRIWKRSWVPLSEFPVAEEDDGEQHSDNTDSADQAA